MDIEKGEYFAITRGIKLRNMKNSIFSFFNPFNESLKLNGEEETKEEPEYDRSWHDCVFLAKEVNYPMVAAEFVVGWHDYFPRVISLNLTEIEIMTLSREYVESFQNSK